MLDIRKRAIFIHGHAHFTLFCTFRSSWYVGGFRVGIGLCLLKVLQWLPCREMRSRHAVRKCNLMQKCSCVSNNSLR